MRPARCVGAALSVAVGILESSGGQQRGSRIVTIMGGPITHGPGMIVS
jgi:protein transport protein SEC23